MARAVPVPESQIEPPAESARAVPVPESEPPTSSRGFQGYGKGNYGELVPPPCADASVGASSTVSLIPFARGPTAEEIASWMGEFEVLPPSVGPIEVGSVVLWRGFKKGNIESTAEEFFRGEVHKIIPDDGHGKRYVVS